MREVSTIQVQGCSEDTGYLLLEDDPTRIPIDQLSKIGHALSSDNSGLPAMGQDSLLRVFYPKGRGETENRLLQNDVVILDRLACNSTLPYCGCRSLGSFFARVSD